MNSKRLTSARRKVHWLLRDGGQVLHGIQTYRLGYAQRARVPSGYNPPYIPNF